PIVDRKMSISGHTNPYADQARGSIVGLQAGTTYEVSLTFSDPDGIVGSATLTGTVATIAPTAPVLGVELFVDAGAPSGDNGSSGSPFNSISTAFTPVIDHRATINGTANPGANEGRLSIVGLTPGTMYEVVWTWSDPDGVTGTNPRSGTISTLSSTALTISESWVSITDGTCGGHAPCFSTIPSAITAAVAGTKIRVMPG